MPSAQVVVTNTATGQSRQATTDATGNYVVPDLVPGTYRIKVSGQGFKESVVNQVVLNVASVSVNDVKLELGNNSEQITVEANAIQVETTSAAVGEVVDGQQVRELPLNGRSFAQLTQLQPGVSAANNLDTKNKGLLSGVDFSVNGNPTTNNLFLVDGANNNDVGSNRTILVYPSVEAISEFKMLRNSYGPEYGQASGAVVSIVTRSGGNQFHGSFGYAGRNDALNSHDFFAARAESAVAAQGGTLPNGGKDKLRRNDYFYSLGGPIKRDKLFFFWSEEWNKEIRGSTRSACVPTAAELGGDFSHDFPLTGADPTLAASYGTDQCGGTMPHLPNSTAAMLHVPALSPAGSLIAQLYPTPNVVPSAGTGGKNWFQSLGSNVYWRQENIRADWNLSSKHTFTARYTQDTWNNPAPNAQGFWGDDPFPAVEGNWDQPSKSVIGRLSSTLTSTLINDVQFSYSANAIITSFGGTNPGLAAQINSAFPTEFPANQKLTNGIPTIWGGAAPYGDSQSLWGIAPYSNNMDLYTVQDNLSKVAGTHTFKTGLYLSWNAKNEDQFGGSDRPSFGLPDWGTSQGATGNALANLLNAGTVFSGVNEINVNPTDLGRWRDYEFYFGDTWKMKRNLTVEYGFRWSLLREPYDANNRMSSWNSAFFNPALGTGDICNGLVVVPGTDPCTAFSQATGVAVSKGIQGPNRALVNNNNHDIAPRLGIIWDPRGDGRTAIRAGVGQFYQRERVSPQVGLSNNAPFAFSTTVNRPLDSTVPTAGAQTSPTDGKDPRGITPNSWQWNLSVERQLGRDTAVELGYVGNKGLHLTSTYDQNGVLPQFRGIAAFASGTSLNNLRVAPGFSGINFFSRQGWSSYHSLQALFRTRFNKHSEIQASYTWSHSIANVQLDNSSGGGSSGDFTDFTNPNLDKGNSAINRPNIFVGNAIFYLPTLGNANGFVKNALGGWEVASIATVEDGNSITIYANGGVTDVNAPSSSVPVPGLNGVSIQGISTLMGNGNSNNQRPNRVFGVSCVGSGADPIQVINPAAFTVVGYQLGTNPTEGRGSCAAPGFINADLALYKNWDLPWFNNSYLGEKLHMQFRIEAFNVLNHPNFRGDTVNTGFTGESVACGTTACSPTNNVITSMTSPVNSSFGQATQTKGAREIQYTLKFTF